MANFSVNQSRHLYVAGAYNSSVTSASDTGTIGAVACIQDGQNKELYFKYKGPGGVLKSDFIQLKNLDYAKAIKASDMLVALSVKEITLDATINSGAPVAGQDYILGIDFKGFFSSGDDSDYYKDAAVHITPDITTASAFYKAMVSALNKAFSREDGATATTNPYVKFEIGYSTNSKSEEGDANWAGATATKIIITEKEQEWQLGTKKARRVLFDLFPSTIYTSGDDLIWGVVADATPPKQIEDTDSSSPTYEDMIPNPALVAGTNAIGNGRAIADLEWFCMGERGDQYRNVGWPLVIPTTYLADPTKEYNLLELHFAFTDSGVNSYRTEKEITVAFPMGASGHEYDAINAFIGAINSATSLSIATLS